MKKMILMAVAVIMGTASAETLTGKIVLKGSNASTSAAQVCMNGSCTAVNSDGSYSLSVPSTGIERRANVTEASDLYRLGQYVVSASGKQVELINMKGQRVASDKGSLDISKVPNGVYMATDGRHVLRFNTMAKSGYATTGAGAAANGVSARATDTLHALGVAYIVIDGDTLKEIPVTSWNLPIGYMVQRNVTVCSGNRFSGDSTQLVFWSDDSVAYVATLGRDQLNSTKQYTGFVYNYYDSTAYMSNKKVFSYFARTYSNDSIKAYSDVGSMTSKSGDFSVDSTFFHLTAYNRTGYSYVPALDTIKKWADSTSLNYNGQWIGIPNGFAPDTAGYDHDGFVHYSSTSQPGLIMISSATPDSARAAAAMAGIDSVRISYNITSTGPDTTRLNVFASYFDFDANTYVDTIYLANGHTSVSVESIGRTTVTDTSVAYALPVSKKILNYTEYGRTFWEVASIDYNPQAMANVHIYFHIKN